MFLVCWFSGTFDSNPHVCTREAHDEPAEVSLVSCEGLLSRSEEAWQLIKDHLIKAVGSSELAEFVLKAKAPGTTQAYVRSLQQYLNWAKGKVEDNQFFPLRTEVVVSFLKSLADRCLSQSSVKVAWSALCWAHGVCNLAPVQSDSVCKMAFEAALRSCAVGQRTIKTYLCVEDMNRITMWLLERNNLSSLRTAVFLNFLFFGFLRPAEGLALTQNCVRLEKDRLIIVVQKSKTDQFSKGEEVHISRSADPTDPSNLYLKYRSELQRTRGTGDHSEAWLFPGFKGKSICNTPMSLNGARTQLKSVLSAVKVSGEVSLHSFRGSGACLAAQGGTAAEDVRRHGRWKSMAILNQFYLRPSPAQKLAVSKCLLSSHARQQD